MLSRRTPGFVVALLLVTSAVAGVAASRTATPGDAPEPTTENHPPSDGANFTVFPSTHQPNSQADYTMLSKGKGPWEGSKGLETIDHYKITTQRTQFNECTPSNARAFGIDRDNDHDGTYTDEPLLRHMSSYKVTGRVITVTIYDEEDLGGSPTHLNDEDETVAKLVDCSTTPKEPGWYQFTGYVNGTNYAGNFQEVTLYSKYFYICDCESRQEAKQKLGPPPYSGSNDDGGSGATATATATPTATDTGGGGDGATATPTPTDTNDQEQSTPTPTDEPDRNSPTATQSSGGNGNNGGNGGNNDGGNDGGGDVDPGATPSVTGPGFGAVAALLALLGAALLVRRE